MGSGSSDQYEMHISEHFFKAGEMNRECFFFAYVVLFMPLLLPKKSNKSSFHFGLKEVKIFSWVLKRAIWFYLLTFHFQSKEEDEISLPTQIPQLVWKISRRKRHHIVFSLSLSSLFFFLRRERSLLDFSQSYLLNIY